MSGKKVYLNKSQVRAIVRQGAKQHNKSQVRAIESQDAKKYWWKKKGESYSYWKNGKVAFKKI